MRLFLRSDVSLWRRKLAAAFGLLLSRQSEVASQLHPAPQPGVSEVRLEPPLRGRCQVALYPRDAHGFPGGRFTVLWDGPGMDGVVVEVDVEPNIGWQLTEVAVPVIAERVWCRFESADGQPAPLVVHWLARPGRTQLHMLLQGVLRRLPVALQRVIQQGWLRQIQTRTPTQPWGWDVIAQQSVLDREGMQQHARSERWDQTTVRLWVDARGASAEAVKDTLRSVRESAVPIFRLGVIAGPESGQQWGDLPCVGDVGEAVVRSDEDWLSIVPAGSELAPSAGYWVGRAIKPAVDLLYTDAHDPQCDSGQGGMVLAGDFDPEWFRETGFLPGLVCMRSEPAQALSLPDAASAWMDWVGAIVDTLSPTAISHVDEVLISAVPSAPRASVAVPEGWERVRTVAGEWSLRPQLPDPAPRVAVVIPTRDRVDLLRLCVDSLRSLTVGAELEICIADNDSAEPETLAYFAELKEQGVRVLPCPGAFNFSRIVNQGVAATRADYVLLLNNDIEIIEADWLQEMLAHAQRPEIGCVGAKLFFPDGRIQHAGITIGLGGLAGHPMRFYPGDSAGYLNRLQHVQSYRAVTAACLLVRREVYEEVGGLNETELAVAYNDVDFCLRVEQAGYRNIWTPHARLVHHESASRGLDTDPVRAARYARECEYLRQNWGTHAPVDGYYHRLLTHADETCSLAPEPWGPRPWLATICGDD